MQDSHLLGHPGKRNRRKSNRIPTRLRQNNLIQRPPKRNKIQSNIRQIIRIQRKRVLNNRNTTITKEDPTSPNIPQYESQRRILSSPGFPVAFRYGVYRQIVSLSGVGGILCLIIRRTPVCVLLSPFLFEIRRIPRWALLLRFLSSRDYARIAFPPFRGCLMWNRSFWCVIVRLVLLFLACSSYSIDCKMGFRSLHAFYLCYFL